MSVALDFKRIFYQAFHSGFFFVLTYASRFLLAIALGKTFLVEDYGVYSLVVTAVAMVSSVIHLGAFHFYTREVPGIPYEKALKLFKSIVGPEYLLLLVGVGAIFLVPGLRPMVMGWLNLPGLQWLWLVAGLLLLETLTVELSRFLFARKEIEQGNVLTFMQTGFWAYAIFFVFLFKPEWLNLTLVLSLWAASLGCAVVFGLLKVKLKPLLRAPIDLKIYKQAVFFGFPMLAAFFLTFVAGFARFFLASHYDTGVVGIYSYHLNIILMVAAISSPFIGNTLEPYAIEALNQGNKERCSQIMSAVFRYRALLVGPLTLVVMFGATALISLMAKGSYADAGGLMLALAPIPLLTILSTTLERLLFLERKTVQIAWAYSIAALIQLGLYWILIPMHPYLGVGLATSAGLLVLCGALYAFRIQSELRVWVPVHLVLLAALPALGLGWFLLPRILHWTHIQQLILLGVVMSVSYLVVARCVNLIDRSEVAKGKEIVSNTFSGWFSKESAA